MKSKTIFTFLMLLLFSIGIYYLSGTYGVLEFILSLIVYTLIFFFLHFLWTKIRKKSLMYFPDFIKYFLYRISILMIIITISFGSLAYFFNEIYPAPMPEYTITNGTKIIKFQAMSHIGTQDFYDTIIKNIIEHKKDGGIYFYEGVKPGTKKSEEKFNKAMGINFDDKLYENFSKLYGVVNQDNRDFIGLINNLDYNVDLNMDEIVLLYEEKIKTKTDPSDVFENKLPLDANKVILETLAELNDRQLKILVYVNKAILNFIIGNDTTQDFLTNNFANTDLFDVILGKRNEVLSDAIIKSESNNIYITYGLLHFDGVMEILVEHDSNWQVISESNLYPITNK